ncbi:hypothetical protein ACFC7A_19290 [Streptomyces niveus]|uniref:hypothetical protein n=1 Tax=Streptomyces niveus TaxID=193462 RepID=UPI0035DB49D1
MRSAREQRSGRPVSAEEIGSKPETFESPLICEFCDSIVEPVRGYKTVPALFRLRRNLLHQPRCALNPTEIINDIARGSHGLAHVTEQGLLRLELPADLISIPPHTPEPGDEPHPDATLIKHDTTTVRPFLPPAITSAAKIARFLQMHDFDPKIVERFRVKPHGQSPVAWGRFCYGPTHESYAELYDRKRTRRTIPHPIAVYGTVQRVDQERGSGRPYATLAVNVTAGEHRHHVVLRSHFETLITPLAVGTHVLAVGDWDVFDRTHIPQLRLFAEDHWQVAYWTTNPATGRPAEPACPPPVTSRQRVLARTEARRRRNAAATPQSSTATPPTPPVKTESTPPPQATVRSARDQPIAEQPITPTYEEAPTEPTDHLITEQPVPPPLPPPPPVPPRPTYPPEEPASRPRRRWFRRRRP